MWSQYLSKLSATGGLIENKAGSCCMNEQVEEASEEDFSKSCLRPEGDTSGCEDSGIKGVEEIQVGVKQAKVINSY